MKRDSRGNQVLLLLLVLTSVALIVFDDERAERSPFHGVRTLAAGAFGPVESAVGGAANGIRDAAARLSSQRDDGVVAGRLAEENAELRHQVRTSELARQRAMQLDKLLRVAAAGQYRTVPAEVVAVAPAQSLSRTVTIDAGSRDGITPDMTVINGDGLVGRVRTVAPWNATVLLAIDPASAVGVRLEHSMEIGIATGRSSGEAPGLSLQLLDGQASVAPGNRVVTFGSRGNRPYVPGVPVGVVAAAGRTPGTLTRLATITPYVDFTALGVVGVVVEPPRRNPRDAVLPPRRDAASPSGSPSASGTGKR